MTYTQLASINANPINDLLSEISKRAIGFEPAFRRLSPNTYQTDYKYPPFDLEKISDAQYVIRMAVAGFKMDDLDISIENNNLKISGKAPVVESDSYYIHNGIAKRDFTRSFVLADYVNVTNARLEDGILTIDLVYELPEEAKPRKIPINSTLIGTIS